MSLGDKLARLRKENNYTQEQLADILGVSRQTISKWESNIAYPETDKLIKLGELYNCSMDYLLKDYVEKRETADNIQKADPKSSTSKPLNINLQIAQNDGLRCCLQCCLARLPYC